MSIININKIDLVNTDEARNVVTLSILDHLKWTHEKEHLILLEEKINLYVDFYTSRNIYKSYPESLGMPLEIKVFFKYKPSFLGFEFIRLAAYELREYNVSLIFEVVPKQKKQMQVESQL